jgi:hypothetical protein
MSRFRGRIFGMSVTGACSRRRLAKTRQGADSVSELSRITAKRRSGAAHVETLARRRADAAAVDARHARA